MKLFKILYLQNRLYYLIGFCIVLFILGLFWSLLYITGRIFLGIIVMLCMIDMLLLFTRGEVHAHRELTDKFSNGDENLVNIIIKNQYACSIRATVIDEIPFQFQIRDFKKVFSVSSNQQVTLSYTLKPVKRGEYHFGCLNIYAASPIGLVSRRYSFDQNARVKVYPSYIQMKQFQLMTTSERYFDIGIKKARRLGHTYEFDQIRSYVPGDDFRSINWKATARKTELMVNQYQDERSHSVYCVIDKGRIMKMAFNGMTILDYAINTSLVLSQIAIDKHDLAGIVTFSNHVDSFLYPGKQSSHMYKILELLYNQKTQFPESDYEQLYATLIRKISQRSLIFLFTNFESLHALKRQIRSISHLAVKHLLVIVFFKNTELDYWLGKKVSTTEEMYIKTTASKFAYEKRQIIKELSLYGIHGILTSPDNLNLKAVNKYLEFKSTGII